MNVCFVVITFAIVTLLRDFGFCRVFMHVCIYYFRFSPHS